MSHSTSALLATITDMQSRLLEMQQQLANQPSTSQGRIPYSYDRAGGRGPNRNDNRSKGRVPFVEPTVSNTSIRLQHASHASDLPLPRPLDRSLERSHGRPQDRSQGYSQDRSQGYSQDRSQGYSQDRSQGRFQGRSQGRFQEENQDVRFETVTLSSVLEKDEEVTFRVIIKKDEAGQPIYTTATASFDGVNLTVLTCELVPLLVGVQSSKPGEILYQFIDALKEQGHLKRSFTIAPWKLCTAVREGQAVTLEALRRHYLATKQATATVTATS